MSLKGDGWRRVLVLVVLHVTPWSLATASPPTVEEAQAFVEAAEARLLEIWIEAERADWVQSTHITYDTEILAALARERQIAATVELAQASTRYDGLELPEPLARKLKLIKLALTLPAPKDPQLTRELARIAASLKSAYGKGKYCPENEEECLDLGQMTTIIAESRDPRELEGIWLGWRTVSPPMREHFERYVELANQGARELGFADLGELWRSKYDMPANEFALEVDRLWQQVRPLYESLHCYVRAALAEAYGADRVPDGQPIPAHLLGNMWAQTWNNIYPLVAPSDGSDTFDLSQRLRDLGVDEEEMVRYGERFFDSLGFEPLPETFWQRSLFSKPPDREVVCHASAWNIDWQDDLRIKMCIQITAEDFATVHHELGHNYYQRAYSVQDPLFRDSANDGFHEALGDTLALSVTPAYLVQLGLRDAEPDPSADLGLLMEMALDKVAFLPFGIVVDRWRWQVFSGETAAADYNRSWWQLRQSYQGVRPPVARGEEQFDPGAKYHIPFNVPYTRYFLATILQFQFHRALCEEIGFEGPLHRCSIYDNRRVGERLQRMMELGISQPWPEALEAVTGGRRMDATALLDYFAPLREWLDEQNRGRTCGW